MLIHIVVVAVAMSPLSRQPPSPLSRIENEMLSRISNLAAAEQGFRFGASEFDLRIPLTGEPEEIIGPTSNATNALAVGSARIEPLDSITSLDDKFGRARYQLRVEDRSGNCLVIYHHVSFDSTFVRGHRFAERCQPLYMADIVRRNRRIARLPFSAGKLDDRWSAALSASGTADVFMDSVVITTSAIALRAAYPVPPTAPVTVDSVSAGLGMGETSWSVVRKSPAIRVDTTLRQGGEWRRGTRRFVIPVDSAFAVTKSWPLFEVYLRAPVTKDNPDGIAWTYAHGSRGLFARIR